MDVEKGSSFAQKSSDALGVLAHEKAGWSWISSGDVGTEGPAGTSRERRYRYSLGKLPVSPSNMT